MMTRLRGSLFTRVTTNNGRNLQHVLRTWQIFFIALTAIIGTGAFNDFARASATVGPAGSIVAIVVVGLIAAAFMEALSELLQIFRTVNPLVEYVHVFVDPALAKCVAGVYWYSYASFMAVQEYVTAANNVSEMATLSRTFLFFVIFPAAFTVINLAPVQWFAWLETFFGALKLMLILGVSMVLFFVAGHERGVADQTRALNLPANVTASLSGTALNAYNTSVNMFVDNTWEFQGKQTFQAFCTVLENIAFAFLGVESIAVMSYEAKDKFALKNSSQIIAWVPLMFYLAFAVAINMCFDWNSPNLPILPYGSTKEPPAPAVLLAAKTLGGGNGALDKTLKAILVICALSAANTTLFISSRTLYGSAKNARPRAILQWLIKVSKNHIPTTAVIFSSVAFCIWLPFASLADTTASLNLVTFFGFSGSIGVLFVWGVTCLAYLRYWYWLWLAKVHLTEQSELTKYNRFNRYDSQFFTPTAYFSLQPGTTILGFLGCLFLVFACPSAVWWGNATAANIFQSYLIHFVVFGSWVGMKAWEWYNLPDDRTFHPWVKIDGGQEGLRRALRTFRLLEMQDANENRDQEMRTLLVETVDRVD